MLRARAKARSSSSESRIRQGKLVDEIDKVSRVWQFRWMGNFKARFCIQPSPFVRLIESSKSSHEVTKNFLLSKASKLFLVTTPKISCQQDFQPPTVEIIARIVFRASFRLLCLEVCVNSGAPRLPKPTQFPQHEWEIKSFRHLLLLCCAININYDATIKVSSSSFSSHCQRSERDCLSVRTTQRTQRRGYCSKHRGRVD